MVDRSDEETVAAARVDLARTPDFQLGALTVRPATRVVEGAGRAQSVEPRVMRVLVALHRAAGGVVTRDDLIESCWDGVVVGDDAINRTIGRLRRLSETDGGGSFRVETLPRVGFRLVAESAPAARSLRPPRRWLAWGALALAGLVALGLGVWWARGSVGSPVQAGTPPLIAVLPFDSLGGTAADQTNADALAMGLSDDLSRTGLRLIGPSSSFQFRGQRKAGAGRDLGAQYVVDGSLRQDGDRLVLALRLQDVARGVTVWTRQFDESVARRSRLRARAAASLGAAIAWPGAARVMRTSQELDAAAVAMFLESTGADRAGDYTRAFAAARRLMAAAPDVPLAQANLGIVTADALPALPAAERPQALADARRAVERAMRRDPRLGEAYVAKALLLPRARWIERGRLFDQAIGVDADNGAAHVYYAAFLSDAGRIGDSLAVAERAGGLDPLSESVLQSQALDLALAGKDQAAAHVLAQAADAWPDSAGLTTMRMGTALLRGDLPAARAQLNDPVAGALFVDRGYGELLRRLLDAMERPGPVRLRAAADACRAPGLGGYGPRLCVLGLASAGDLDSAFALAQQLAPDVAGGPSVDQDARWLRAPERVGGLYILYAPGLRVFRSDPRATAMFERLGLAAYWRSSGHAPDFCRTEAAPVCATLTRRR